MEKTKKETIREEKVNKKRKHRRKQKRGTNQSSDKSLK